MLRPGTVGYARVYGHTTTAMHGMGTPFPLPFTRPAHVPAHVPAHFLALARRVKRLPRVCVVGKYRRKNVVLAWLHLSHVMDYKCNGVFGVHIMWLEGG